MSSVDELIAAIIDPEVEEPLSEVQTSDDVQSKISAIVDTQDTQNVEMGRLFARGLTFGASDIIRGIVDAEVNDKSIEDTFDEQDAAREQARDINPVGSLGMELLGGLPTGVGLQSALAAKGYGVAKQGAIEGGLYGLGTEGPLGGIVGAAGGGAIGALFAKGAGVAAKRADKVAEDGLKQAQKDTSMRILKAESGEVLSQDEIADEIIKLNTRRTIERNRFQYDDYDKWYADLTKKRAAATKAGKNPDDVVLEVAEPAMIQSADLSHTYEYMMRTFNLTNSQVQRAIKKMGGVRMDDGIKNIDDLIQADKLFTGGTTGRKTPGAFMKWYERNFTPVTEVIRRYYSPQVAAVTERVWERTMRHNANFMDNMVYTMKPVIQFAEKPENKALLLDLHKKPQNMAIFRQKLATAVDEEQLAAFDQWWKYVENKSSEARKLLFKAPDKDSKGWDIFFMHSEKRSASEKLFATKGHDPKYDTIDALRARNRKIAEEMTPEELDDWMNPILAHSKYIMDNEVLVEGAKKYGLAPSMEIGETTHGYFAQLEKRFLRDTGDAAAAKEMADMLSEAWNGSRRAPPAPVRAFMNLAYAGTLAQFKSAVLNLHDIAVSMVNNGVRPTLRGLFSRTDKEFGATVRQMMGEQNFGEFVREFDKLLVNPSAWEKVGWGTKKFSDGAMFVSGFGYMDRVGKGVVLRAAVEAARDSAKAGRFMSEYADFFIDSPMAGKVARFLKSDIPVAQWDRDAAAIIEDIAFSKLGEQQLITAIGRPLGYLNHPILRPAYAMTGFAIKQQALLRRNVIDEFRKGNYKRAAQYASQYVVYAGIGYGFINETRNAVFKGDDFEPEDIMLGAVDQVAAALTLNRLGDEYSREMFMANPVEYLMTSFVPPGGMNDAIGQAILGDFEELAVRTPGVGDFIKRMLKESEDE